MKEIVVCEKLESCVVYREKPKQCAARDREKRKKKVYCVLTNTLGFLSLTNILGLKKKIVLEE